MYRLEFLIIHALSKKISSKNKNINIVYKNRRPFAKGVGIVDLNIDLKYTCGVESFLNSTKSSITSIKPFPNTKTST